MSFHLFSSSFSNFRRIIQWNKENLDFSYLVPYILPPSTADSKISPLSMAIGHFLRRLTYWFDTWLHVSFAGRGSRVLCDALESWIVNQLKSWKFYRKIIAILPGTLQSHWTMQTERSTKCLIKFLFEQRTSNALALKLKVTWKELNCRFQHKSAVFSQSMKKNEQCLSKLKMISHNNNQAHNFKIE